MAKATSARTLLHHAESPGVRGSDRLLTRGGRSIETRTSLGHPALNRNHPRTAAHWRQLTCKPQARPNPEPVPIRAQAFASCSGTAEERIRALGSQTGLSRDGPVLTNMIIFGGPAWIHKTRSHAPIQQRITKLSQQQSAKIVETAQPTLHALQAGKAGSPDTSPSCISPSAIKIQTAPTLRTPSTPGSLQSPGG